MKENQYYLKTKFGRKFFYTFGEPEEGKYPYDLSLKCFVARGFDAKKEIFTIYWNFKDGENANWRRASDVRRSA